MTISGLGTAAKQFSSLGDNLPKWSSLLLAHLAIWKPLSEVCRPWSHFSEVTLSPNCRAALFGGVGNRLPSLSSLFSLLRRRFPPLLWFLCLCNRSTKVNYLLRSFGNGLGCGWWEVHWIRLWNICIFCSSKSTALWNSSPHLSHNTIVLLIWTPHILHFFLEYTTGCRKGCIVQALHLRKSYMHGCVCMCKTVSMDKFILYVSLTFKYWISWERLFRAGQLNNSNSLRTM